MTEREVTAGRAGLVLFCSLRARCPFLYIPTFVFIAFFDTDTSGPVWFIGSVHHLGVGLMV